MAIYLGGQEYSKAYLAGNEISGIQVGGNNFISTAPSYEVERTLDRTFSNSSPASGGGNVTPDTFTHEGNTWQLWQVIPYLGQGVVPSSRFGQCRIHLRNRAVSRGAMQLSDMPSQLILTHGSWEGSPWVFNRPTSDATFTTPGRGDSARRSLDYIPARSPLANAAASGVAQGQTFTIRLIFG